MNKHVPHLGVDVFNMEKAMPDQGVYRYEFNGHTFGVQYVDEKGGMKWTAIDLAIDALFPKSKYSQGMPATAYNMHPDLGQFGRLLKISTKGEYFGGGIKALSGLRIIRMGEGMSGQFEAAHGRRLDVRRQTLSDNDSTDANRVFIGNYTGPIGLAGTPEFDKVIRDQWLDRFAHRFSGKENKMPNHHVGNTIMPAVGGLDFTTFVKFPAVGGKESNGLLEWAGMRMAEATGLKTAKYAMIDQGRQFPPAIAVERFDIPRKPSELEREWVLMQDFYGLMGEDPALDTVDRHPKMFRYNELLARLIEYTNEHDPKNTSKNAKAFIKRLLVSWVANDPDLHAKNLSIIQRVDPVTKKITAVEFSPTYDSVGSTMTGSDGEPLHYNLRKKKGQPFESQPPRHLNMNDFLDMLSDPKVSVHGKPYCIFRSKEQAEKFIREVVSAAAFSAVKSLTNVPSFIDQNAYRSELMVDMQQMAKVAVRRAESIGARIPDIKFDPGLKKLHEKYGSGARKKTLEATGLTATFQGLVEKLREGAGSVVTGVTVGGAPVFSNRSFATPVRAPNT